MCWKWTLYNDIFFITAHQLLGLIRGGSWPESDGLVQGQAAPVGSVYCVSITPTQRPLPRRTERYHHLLILFLAFDFLVLHRLEQNDSVSPHLGLKQHYFFLHEKSRKQDFPCVWENIAFKKIMKLDASISYDNLILKSDVSQVSFYG